MPMMLLCGTLVAAAGPGSDDLARALGGARLLFLAWGALASLMLAGAAFIFARWRRAMQDQRPAQMLVENERLRALFGKFVPPAVVQQLLDGNLRASGSRRDVSVLLADIRDFTQISEKLAPEELMRFLNDYFSRMTEIVLRNGGSVDKFMGDGLLAVFGAPATQADHAARAVCCALEMHFCLERFNAERSKKGLEPVRFGVAVNTGPAVAGIVGSKERMEYTVVGDTVNTVSRLESLNPRLGTELLATEATYRLTRELFAFRAIGRVCVRGRGAPVGVYQLLGPAVPPLTTGRGQQLEGGVEPGLERLDLSGILDPAQVDADILRRA